MSIIRKYIFFFACLLFAFDTYGQAARTPFTSFGIGEPYGNALVSQQGMAGVGVSQPQFWFINNQNPALLVYNSVYTGFQAGIISERRTISNDTLSETTQGGNLNYLVTAFPIKPTKWTTSVGLMPYTAVNYKLQYDDNVVASNEQVRVTEEGSGGLTQLYWSNGVRLTKDIAVGLKASYIFSSIVNNYENQLIDSPQPITYTAGIEEKSYVRDFTFGTGLSFSKDSLFSKRRYRLSFGAVYNFATELDAKKTDRIYRSTPVGDTTDVSVLPSSRRGSYSIPSSLTVGVSLSRGTRWTIGTEVSYQDWTTFKNVNGQQEALQQSWRIALGGEITPDQFDTENYFKRLTYRAGVSMEENPFLANGNPVRDRGINFGFSMPAGRSSLDFAFRYGKRGDKSENILEENYLKIFFGITFNDQWFIKRRFD
jgi:long-subunit fatty acid transport protein